MDAINSGLKVVGHIVHSKLLPHPQVAAQTKLSSVINSGAGHK